MASDEENRAAEYRRMMAARERNDRARARALAGSKSARRELEKRWEPLTLSLREGRQP